MDHLRIVSPAGSEARVPCCRCGFDRDCWDRIAGKTYCPNCQEDLALGEGEPLVERTETNRCIICSRVGTIRFLTYPLRVQTPVEMDLCPEHLRALVGRCLRPQAFRHICRRLAQLRLSSGEIFLLHDAFYDKNGRALQPAVD
jgi:hypothetical protein